MRLLLIDGHYYLYRSFFAIRGLTNSRGEPTNAIYGFLKAMRKMVADVKPGLGAVLWDQGLPDRRTSLQAAYKQHRPEMPAEMRSQEAWLQRNLPLTGFSSLSVTNTEADDLIASYACQAVATGHDVVIATNDKDILQLTSERILIYSTAKADTGPTGFALLGPREIQQKWGVEPSQIAEILALTGDSSDNIPGVPGVGAKTASQLVRTYRTVENLLNQIDTVEPEKLKEKLAGAKELIAANRQMVALDDDLPLPKALEELRIVPQYDALMAALEQCDFKTLLKEVDAEAKRANTIQQAQLL
ncbi:MAG TPA: 5'-3' exonuclease H3TH domain-containing protein [Terrimicrobiaceae bacterium]|nr:5'-3' exonuclease H3TH domain-containing protein [Terrimicrobiaceae bacterium]